MGIPQQAAGGVSPGALNVLRRNPEYDSTQNILPFLLVVLCIGAFVCLKKGARRRTLEAIGMAHQGHGKDSDL